MKYLKTIGIIGSLFFLFSFSNNEREDYSSWVNYIESLIENNTLNLKGYDFKFIIYQDIYIEVEFYREHIDTIQTFEYNFYKGDSTIRQTFRDNKIAIKRIVGYDIKHFDREGIEIYKYYIKRDPSNKLYFKKGFYRYLYDNYLMDKCYIEYYLENRDSLDSELGSSGKVYPPSGPLCE